MAMRIVTKVLARDISVGRGEEEEAR